MPSRAPAFKVKFSLLSVSKLIIVPENALAPIDVNVCGNVMLESFVLPLNAFSRISAIPSEITSVSMSTPSFVLIDFIPAI